MPPLCFCLLSTFCRSTLLGHGRERAHGRGVYYPAMRHTLCVALGLAMLGSGARVFAQDNAAGGPGRCTTPDSIAIAGNRRVTDGDVRGASGLVAGVPVNARTIQDAVKNLFNTGQFDDVQITCAIGKGGARPTLLVQVSERPVLDAVHIKGTDRLSEKTIRDLIDLTPGRPLQAGNVTHAVTRIDSAYQNAGYYLAKVVPDTATADGKTTVNFNIDEGHRLAISGIQLHGNHVLSDHDIVRAMSTKPEAFPFWRKGEFDEDKFAADLAEHLPDLYARLGYVDFQVLKDTVLVDRKRGKALLDITVSEGRPYKVGTFDVIGNRHFSTEEINRFYPFGNVPATLTERAADVLLQRRRAASGIFDRAKWDDATAHLRTAYNNDGYIYASVRPISERVVGPDSQPRVNLRWEVDQHNPAIVNRIDITGNDYTTKGCIRDALVIIPGDVFSQDRLIRSYQNIGNLGFFETPIPPPDTRPASDSGGDVDLVFHVKEKHTGNVNFGASTGQGTGIGGFIGFDQPNLFGECKRGSIQWQYGRYINNLQISYTDPTIRQSRVSGTVTAYNSQSRYFIGDLGQSTNLGGSVQLGWPVGSLDLHAALYVVHVGIRALQWRHDDTPRERRELLPRLRPVVIEPLNAAGYPHRLAVRRRRYARDRLPRLQRRPPRRRGTIPAAGGGGARVFDDRHLWPERAGVGAGRGRVRLQGAGRHCVRQHRALLLYSSVCHGWRTVRRAAPGIPRILDRP